MTANTHQAGRSAPFGTDFAAIAAMRMAAVERIRLAGVRHAQVVWNRLGKNPVGPHGLAFLYVSSVPAATGYRLELEIATRLFRGDGENVEDLQLLLGKLTDLVSSRTSFDPRKLLSDRSEARPAAAFAGVAVYSVDSAETTWAQVRAGSPNLTDLPGRSYLCLVDGTLVLSERRDLADYQVKVRSTHKLERHLAQAPDGWRRDEKLAEDAATAPTWRALKALTKALDERHPPPPV